MKICTGKQTPSFWSYTSLQPLKKCIPLESTWGIDSFNPVVHPITARDVKPFILGDIAKWDVLRGKRVACLLLVS